MESQRKRILAISGSTRSRSTNESILRAIAEAFQGRLEVEILKGIDRLPHFNPDVSDEESVSAVREFRAAIDHADGVVICTPEYVFSLPGTLKNALDWTVSTTVFSDKPVALIVASGLGEKAFESLLLIMKTLGAVFDSRTSLHIPGARARVGEDGHIEDATWLDIRSMMEALIEKMKG